LRDILVAVDNSKHSERVVDFAIDLAKKSGSPIKLVYVIQNVLEEPAGVRGFENAERFRDAYFEYLQGIGNAVTARFADKITRANVKCQCLSEIGNPALKVLDLAKLDEAKVIVVGLRGIHRLGRLRSLGSVARRIIENAECPVFVVPTPD
jgi:nucleotide-binding universal stress UspA family protein